jgi:uncharacterized protein (DUF4213/DUF364 family)
MWQLYDELIEGIPAGFKLVDIAQTDSWMLACSEKGVGSALKFGRKESFSLEKYRNMPLQDVAALLKSWDFKEASLGLAAINSYYNQQNKVSEIATRHFIGYQDVFEQLLTINSTQKIGMVGHFPFVDRYPQYRQQIYVFELKPRGGDYPASASEYLLPEMDQVYITGSALINKTLPRLLELSQNATTILVGSSCPFSEILFQQGVNILAGTLYQQTLHELIISKNSGHLPLSKYGQPVMIKQRKGEKNEKEI